MAQLWVCRAIRLARSSFPEVTHVHDNNQRYRCTHLTQQAECQVTTCRAHLCTTVPLTELQPLSTATGDLELITDIIFPDDVPEDVIQLFNKTNTVEQAAWLAKKFDEEGHLDHPIALIAA